MVENRYGMEINASNTRIMMTGPKPMKLNEPIKVNCEDLEQVSSFKYLGSTITEEGTSKVEVVSSMGSATSALSRLDKIWKE